MMQTEIFITNIVREIIEKKNSFAASEAMKEFLLLSGDKLSESADEADGRNGIVRYSDVFNPVVPAGTENARRRTAVIYISEKLPSAAGDDKRRDFVVEKIVVRGCQIRFRAVEMFVRSVKVDVFKQDNFCHIDLQSLKFKLVCWFSERLR
jgi:hypothetical protein